MCKHITLYEANSRWGGVYSNAAEYPKDTKDTQHNNWKNNKISAFQILKKFPAADVALNMSKDLKLPTKLRTKYQLHFRNFLI